MGNQNQLCCEFYRYPLQILHKPHISSSSKRKGKWKKQSHPLKSMFFLSCKDFILLFQLLLLTVQSVSSMRWDGIVVTQADYQSLQAIKHDFVDPNGLLRSWNDSGYGACSGRWVGIKCAQGQVIVIQLPWRGLGGRISEKIGQLSALRKLSLHDNFIGGMVPTSLGFLPNLRGLILFNNRFSGSIPPSLGSCLFLQNLDLSNNLLTGAIPATLANSSRLYRLNLSFNALSGSIPIGLTRSPSIAFFALEYNNISGSIPDTWGATMKNNFYQLQSLTLDHNLISGSIPVSLSKMDKLEVMSISHNQIDGVIPREFGALSKLRILNLSNNLIAGNFTDSLCNLSSLVQLDLGNNHLENHIPDGIGGLKNLSVLDLRRNQFNGHIPTTLGKISNLTQLDLSENDLTGDIPVSLADLTDLNFLNVSYNKLSGPVPIPLSQKFKSSSFIGNLQLCGYSASTPCSASPPSESIPPSSPVSVSNGSNGRHRKLSTKDIILIAAGILLAVLLLLCCVLFCCLIRRRAASRAKNGQANGRATTTRAEKGTPPSMGGEVEAGGDAGGKLVHYFDGPLVFTADDLLCATAEIMGKSTYGTVYKATLEDGSQVAVKRLREKITKNLREFEEEVNLLGKIRHPNLLSLRAYYLGPKGEKLLVFDFMSRGSLGAFLHARGPDTLIDWPTRMNIVMGAARGLCYLHTTEDMVHGNLTGGNILLDEHTNTKISDYGLSRLMTTTANSNVAATAASLGYRAPELSKLKKPTTKTDVYSLGVIMLELLTGKSPSESVNGMDLPQWVASIVQEEWTNEVFDLELMKDASTTGDELLNTLKLALHCVDPSPAERPDVQQVLQQLEEIKPELAVGASDDHKHGDTGESAGVLSTSDD